jgi:hypothetical protein
MSLKKKIEEIRERSARKLIKLKCDLDYKKFERQIIRQKLRQKIVFNDGFDSTRELRLELNLLVRNRIHNEQGDKYWWKSIPKF